jgi:UDPglucose--hexose-1-phosphate uridylyltransferase
MNENIRTDLHLGTIVHIVADRQHRPNLPTQDCPFCVGGLEAPLPYDVLSFPNRWPALGEGYCEVVLYSPHHDATLHSIGSTAVRSVIDLWAERTTALRSLPHGEHVMIFENRGAEIGATISHPHGQIYAFDHVPHRSAQQFKAEWIPEAEPSDRLIFRNEYWTIYTEYASVFPINIRLAPTQCFPDIPSLPDKYRTDLASTIVKLFAALDGLFDTALPYMMWCNQAPRQLQNWPTAWFNMEIVSPWRAAHVPRYIAAVEVATQEYFNPVDPADVAARLRALM